MVEGSKLACGSPGEPGYGSGRFTLSWNAFFRCFHLFTNGSFFSLPYIVLLVALYCDCDTGLWDSLFPLIQAVLLAETYGEMGVFFSQVVRNNVIQKWGTSGIILFPLPTLLKKKMFLLCFLTLIFFYHYCLRGTPETYYKMYFYS